MKFRLIRDARRIWHRLWSVRLSLLSALLSTIETCMNYYATGQAPIFVIGAALVSIATAVSRLVSQDSLYDSYEQAP
jgi:hypothetical protein